MRLQIDALMKITPSTTMPRVAMVQWWEGHDEVSPFRLGGHNCTRENETMIDWLKMGRLRSCGMPSCTSALRKVCGVATLRLHGVRSACGRVVELVSLTIYIIQTAHCVHCVCICAAATSNVQLRVIDSPFETRAPEHAPGAFPVAGVAGKSLRRDRIRSLV